MKKTIVSLAAAAALTTGAFAADKGIDIVTNGQAVLWYQTNETDGTTQDLFDQGNSVAAAGIQLDLAADLKNNFTFGAQVSHITSIGLENNLVSGMPQATTTPLSTANSLTDEMALTKAFIAKKIGNTTLKMGRQEIPKSLSPLAYTEGWNVFKNTFDAIIAVNTDLPNTTIVGAYVGASTGHTWMSANSTGTGLGSTENLLQGAYMLTAATTVIPMTTLTASYYRATHTASAYWVTANVAPKDAPMGLKVDLQAGSLDADAAGAKDTDAFGAKVSAKMGAISAYAAYSDVNDGALAARNLGTGDKTPLFTSMVLTEDQASLDADAWTAAVSYNAGDMGNVMLRYGQTDTGARANDAGINSGGSAAAEYTELDLIYSVKAGGVKYFAGYINRETELDAGGKTESDHIRVWARYNF
jgi:hypothetical protein